VNTAILILLAFVGSTAFTALVSHLLQKTKYNADVRKVGSDIALADANKKDIITQASERALNMVVSQLEVAQKRILFLEEQLANALERITQLEQEAARPRPSTMRERRDD